MLGGRGICHSHDIAIDDLNHHRVPAFGLKVEDLGLGARGVKNMPLEIGGGHLVRGVLVLLYSNRVEGFGAINRFCGTSDGS